MGKETDPGTEAANENARAFIERWERSGGYERGNAQSFLKELCDLLEVPQPDPVHAETALNDYVFERSVTFRDGDVTSTGRIDLYKRDCFVLEAKQGVNAEPDAQQPLAFARELPRTREGHGRRGTGRWDVAMTRAKNQAERYAHALPEDHGWPPFLVVVDVGHMIELHANFSRSGRQYQPFPDPRHHRVFLKDLADAETRALLRAVWTEPLALDPARRAARVTRDVAERIAKIARRLEGRDHHAESVAGFLMRLLFTMFAEDVGLLPHGSLTRLLEEFRGKVRSLPPMLRDLWKAMNTGGFSPGLREDVLPFNGGLFADPQALEIDDGELELLIDAAQADWKEVEPAIFGALLERALDPVERHKLGAHYTPRAYVERLVLPTVIEPLREEWEGVQAEVAKLGREGERDKARERVLGFHKRLCGTRVLDPACGSGNFLYVTMEHMKRLEGEVLDTLSDLGGDAVLSMPDETALLTVDPHQFLGIEVNPRAAWVAEMVLWIGYLQWHFRTRGKEKPPTPVLKAYGNIERRDAVLAWDRVETIKDAQGKPVMHWDGQKRKSHPVTGELVPDETGQVESYRYVNPRKAAWPAAEFVVGNPPFVGNWRMRSALGDGYVEALRATIADVPESADYVMYWWDHAAELARAGKLRRFGLIATNSLRQTFNRKVLARHLAAKDPLSVLFAIPDHPWVDASEGADVRISMTVAAAGDAEGRLLRVVAERDGDHEGREVEFAEREGRIFPDLTIGVDVGAAKPLRANEGLCCPGVKLHGAGFIVTPEQAESLGLGRTPGLERHIRPYRNGRDITATPRGVMVIDLFGLAEAQVRDRFPHVYQWVLDRVKPERDAKAERDAEAGGTKDSKEYAERWWLFGKPRSTLRGSLAGLQRYIATVETSRRRFFVFLDAAILPDNKLVNIASDDAYDLGVLSSSVHVTWALTAGARLGVGNDPVYVKSACFDRYPFPDPTDAQKRRIRELGEALDAHRKARQAEHPRLTNTDMYNVLEKLRAGEVLADKERRIYDEGLVGVLKEIHDDLDRAVFDAYGWPPDLADEEILERLVALNAVRAAEEAEGKVRWLRPEFQNPTGAVRETKGLALPATKEKGKAAAKRPWPGAVAAQAQALLAALAQARAPLDTEGAARLFQRAPRAKVAEVLELLETLGKVRRLEDGRFAA